MRPPGHDAACAPPLTAVRLAAWSLALGALALLLLPYAGQVGFTGFMADDALYLLLADALKPAHAGDPLLVYVRQVAHLPPLYPALLALAGAGSDALARAHLVQGVLVVAALGVQAAYVRQVSGSDRLGLLTLAVLAVLPATLLFATELWSEFLYLVLAGLALAGAHHARVEPRAWYWAAGLAGLAATTRGLGLALVGALVVGVAARRRRALPAVVALAALPLLLARLAGQGDPGGYVDVFDARVANLLRILDVVMANLHAAGAGWAGLFEDHPGIPARVVGGLVAGLALVGAWPRLRRLEVDAVYAGLYLGLVAIWPFPDFMTRFLYPLAPLALLYLGCGVRRLATHLAPRQATRMGVPLASAGLAVLLVAVAGWSSPLLARYASPPPGELAAYRSTRYWTSPPEPARALADLAGKHAMTLFLRGLPAYVGPRQCVHARHPAAVMLHAHRLAFPAPTGETRPQRPPCRFHLVLADRAQTAAGEEPWPGARVVAASRVDGRLVARLLRYDD
ncbi:MAG: hypothetical protein H6977_13165 [Gammaproteobacteria bacterium]|nr:hypothetical protein [Gammaproteobacteria bacterium]